MSIQNFKKIALFSFTIVHSLNYVYH